MKLKEGFITHQTQGEHITVSAGGSGFNGLIRSNGTAGFIVECLKTDTTEEAIVEKMLAKYDAPRTLIAADVAKVLASLREIGAIDD
ncbi:MAG: PqqD family protein [Clostridia bacterium]|nr:PqqD family protein [Clostridia bacterium]